MHRIVLVRNRSGDLSGRDRCGGRTTAARRAPGLACANAHSPSIRFCSQPVLLSEPELTFTATIVSAVIFGPYVRQALRDWNRSLRPAKCLNSGLVIGVEVKEAAVLGGRSA